MFFGNLPALKPADPTRRFRAGCGGGHGMHVWRLLHLCRKLVVADVVSYSALYEGRFLRLLAEKHERNNRAIDLSKVVFVESDAQNQMFRDGLFDLVVSFNTFEHVPIPARLFAKSPRRQTWRTGVSSIRPDLDIGGGQSFFSFCGRTGATRSTPPRSSRLRCA